MARVIDDLRTLSLAESGALTLHRESSDVHVLIDDAVAPFRPTAEAEGVALAVDAPASLPQLDIDPVRIRQVLGNLITNALRYTPRGGRVEVQAREGQGRVSISVSDTGSGIAADVLPHVFERFYRSADSTGSGLGLPI
ncbi:MAG: two-component sensor histidine kinase, partial [Chloroflexi bacterium]